MNRYDLNNSYTYTEDNLKKIATKGINKEKKTSSNRKILSVCLLAVLVFILIFLLKRYNNKEAINALEERLNAAVNIATSKVSAEDFTDDYIVVKFPDKNEIITKNGKMSFNNIEYDEIKKGYIVVYKDGSISFRISDGTYCIYKDYNDSMYELFIWGDCHKYDIKYK